MNQLTVVEQKIVPFNGNLLQAVKTESGKIFVGVSWVCSGIGFSKSQKDTQVQKVQSDLVLKQGCLKFQAGVFDQHNSTLAIDIEYLPIWLAKISITPTMQEENQPLVENLVNYQLKAKDVLAEAFIKKQKPLSEIEQLKAAMRLSLATSEEIETLKEDVVGVKTEIEHLKDNIYINSSQAKAIRRKVGEKVYDALGGNKTNAFKHLKNKTFAACWREFRNYFDISEYRELPRVKFEDAMRFLFAWQPNTELRLEIEFYNTQMQLKLVK